MNTEQLIRARENAFVIASEMSMLIGFNRHHVEAHPVLKDMCKERAVDALDTAARAMGFRLVPIEAPAHAEMLERSDVLQAAE